MHYPLFFMPYIFYPPKIRHHVYIVQRFAYFHSGWGFLEVVRASRMEQEPPWSFFLVFLNFLYSILPNNLLTIVLVAP